MPSYDQPADETPIVTAADVAGRTEGTTDAAPPPEARPADPDASHPAVEAALAEAASAIARSYDAAATTVDRIITDIRDTIASQSERAKRAVERVAAGVDKLVGDARNAAAEAGVPVPFGTGATAADLADSSGMAFVNIVKTASDNAALTPAGRPPAATYCTWTWVGGAWVGEGPTDSPPPSPESRPGRDGLYPGEIVVAVCADPPPAPAPPPAPPAPGPGPTPVPGGRCWYQVRPLSPGGPPCIVTPDTDAADIPHYGYWVVWTDHAYPGQILACQFGRMPTTFPAGLIGVYDQAAPGVGWTVYGTCDDRDCAGDSPPPPPPPPPVPPPPPGPACPPPVIQVNCAPACPPPYPAPSPPTVPVPPKPSPPTTPPPPPPPPDGPAKPEPLGVIDPSPLSLAVNWDTSAVCARLAAGVVGGGSAGGAKEPGQETAGFLGIVAGAGKKFVPELLSLMPGVAAAATAVAALPTPIADTMIPWIIGAGVNTSLARHLPNIAPDVIPSVMSIGATIGLASKAESLTSMPWGYLFQHQTYALQYYAPQYIPSQPGVDELYLRNRIDDSYWECLTRANGNLPITHRLIRDAKAVRPILSDVIQLRLRDVIRTDDEYVRRARELGVTDPGHAREFLTLANWVPPPTDLISFMVRDAADDAIAAKYQYDKDFTDKFAGPIKDWARSQGITEDAFKYNWRSHWKIPSNTQLYSMLHRLRADRPEVEAWEGSARDVLSQGGAIDPATRPPVVTVDDVKTALEVNDNAPGWVDALISISYHPLTNTDARRAYEIGFFNERQLEAVMLDNGYAPADARTLVQYFKAERNKRVAVQTGVLSPRLILSGYRNGELTRDAAFALLEDAFPDANVRTRELNRAEAQTDMEIKRDVIKAVKRGFVYGEYGEGGAADQLGAAGVSLDVIPMLLQRFTAAKMGHKKEPRVQMLCQWYTHRIITREQYFERLLNLGYTGADAARISEVCHVDRVVSERNAAAAAAAKAMREERQRAHDYAKMVKDAKAELADLQRQIEAAKAAAGGAGGA